MSDRASAVWRRGSGLRLQMLGRLVDGRHCPVRLSLDFWGDGPFRRLFLRRLAGMDFLGGFRLLLLWPVCNGLLPGCISVSDEVEKCHRFSTPGRSSWNPLLASNPPCRDGVFGIDWNFGIHKRAL